MITKSKSNTSLHYLSRLSIFLIIIASSVYISILIIFQIKSLHTTPCPSSSSESEKLQNSVTFLPLKDLRFSTTPQEGHTWFMSSTRDTRIPNEVQYQKYPSPSSHNRLLCLSGNDTHDGAYNSYALAYVESLPPNATLLKGLTFVTNNHYHYDNIWHGLTATFPLIAWHRREGRCAVPTRWILYQRGEIRVKVSQWLRLLLEAAFQKDLEIERLDLIGDKRVNCFEEAVVTRHYDGGMSRERRMEGYDLLRCKARVYCKVANKRSGIGLTLFMRTGPRSFRNSTAVIRIFERECVKVEGCRLTVAHSNNLTFCQQVELMSATDVLVSPHGAQLTNMFLMNRNSSVMEFFPKGWLKLAGSGQYVYRSIASWSGMNHRGAWRDPNGDTCPFPEDDRRCMSVFKHGLIGHDESYFGEWAKSVLDEMKMRKSEEQSSTIKTNHKCECS